MSMMAVPSMARGARSLPPELRGMGDPVSRLHGNMSPVVTGVGALVCDEYGVCYDDGSGTDTSQVPVDSSGIPLSSPSVVFSPTPATIPASGQPVNWGAIVNAAGSNLNKTIALTQGGSVLPSGAMYGSPTTASLAAGSAAFGNAATGGAALSSPLILLLIGGVVLLMAGKK